MRLKLVAWFAAAEVRSWQRCLVDATANKVRVMRPPKGDDE